MKKRMEPLLPTVARMLRNSCRNSRVKQETHIIPRRQIDE